MTLTETGNPIGAAAAGVRASVKDAEKAAAEEGIEPNGVLGGFVQALKWALLKLADLIERFEASLVGKMEAQQRQIESFHQLGEIEITRLREVNRSAALAIRKAEVLQETIVANVCKDLVKNLTSEAQRWLVVAEGNIHRRRARIFAVKMTLATLALLGAGFGTGYQMRAWQDEPAVQSLARCMKSPLRVTIKGQPDGDYVCKLDTLVPRGWGDFPAELKRRWLWLWPYAAG